jgi:hypothetical protein
MAALAQPAPRVPAYTDDVARQARTVSDLMKADEKKQAARAKQDVKLTPPDQLFKNRGQATLLYALPINKPPEYAAYLRYVTDEKLFQEAIDTVNGLVALPRNMIVFFRDCDIACWLFGASPFHQVDLVARGLLPADRAAKCGQEFQDLRTSWKTLADPKLKRALK